MSKQEGYKSLEVYNLSRKLVMACYELTADLPADESKNLTHYIRMAAVDVHISVAQGAFLNSHKKRKKFVRQAQSSLVVIEAATEVLADVGFVKPEQLNEVTGLCSGCHLLLNQLAKK
jgi:four helix bundle protein